MKVFIKIRHLENIFSKWSFNHTCGNTVQLETPLKGPATLMVRSHRQTPIQTTVGSIVIWRTVHTAQTPTQTQITIEPIVVCIGVSVGVWQCKHTISINDFTWSVCISTCIILDQLGYSLLLEHLTWFIKWSKQFNQSDIAALTLTMTVNRPLGSFLWAVTPHFQNLWKNRSCCKRGSTLHSIYMNCNFFSVSEEELESCARSHR